MLIAGQEIDPNTSVDSIIEKLEPHRYFPEGPEYFPDLQPVTGNMALGDESAMDAIVNTPFHAVSDVHSHHSKLMDIGKKQEFMIRRRGMSAILKALNIYSRGLMNGYANDYTYGIHEASGFIYILLSSYLPYIRGCIEPDEWQDLNGIMNIAQKQNSQTHGFCSSAAKNEQAWDVNQREVGFSCEEPLGTRNLLQCVSIVVRDPFTKKTAVAHVDLNTDPESIAEIFRRMPLSAGSPLEVRLLGAKTLPSVSESKFAEFTKTLDQKSISILKRVLEQLKKYPVNILSADVLQSNQPTEFVVLPESGEIRFETPVKSHELELSMAKCMYVPMSSLQTSFDLTVCHKTAPILIDKDMLYSIHTNPIDEKYLRSVMADYPSIPFYLQNFDMLSTQCKNTVSALIAHFNAAADRCCMPLQARDDAIAALLLTPIFVGNNAEIANKKLFEMLDKDWWIDTGYGNTKTFDINALKNYNPSPAYSYIEEAFGKSFQRQVRANASATRPGPG